MQDYSNFRGNRNNSTTHSPQKDKQPVDLTVRDKNGTVMNFKTSWITDGADQEMVDYTDEAGKRMKNGNLTASQIRNIYGEIKRIQIGGYEKNKASFLLLQPKLAYIVGRTEAKSRGNSEGIRVYQDIFLKAAKLVNNEKTYQNFCNLMEALVAYHKYYGGKD